MGQHASSRDILITGATVVDGTGTTAPYPADVRVTDGVISEIGPGLEPKGEAGSHVVPVHVDGSYGQLSESIQSVLAFCAEPPGAKFR